ncbi:MAG: hypothetical protein Tsb0013_02260 [Phycisphaerales bacterium]
MRTLIRALDPRAFFGPIFFKEMLVSGRRSFTHWTRFVTGVLLALFLWMIVAAFIDSEISYSSGASRIQAYARIAPMIALVVGWMMAIILPIVASAFGSGAMLEEKKSRTMESILSTPMSAWSVVASKLSSRLIQVLILALIALPVLLAARAFGGLDATTIIAFTCVSLCQAVFACSVATWCSMRVKRAWSAMSTGVTATVLLSLLPFVPVMVGAWSSWPQRAIEWAFLVAIHTSPVGVLIAVSAGEELPIPPGITLFEGSTWVGASLTCILLALIMMMFTASRLRLETVGKTRTRVKRSADGKLKRRTKRARTRSRTIVGNPVAWREVRQPLFKGARKIKVLSTLIGAGLLIYIYTQADPRATGFHVAMLMIVFFICCLIPLNATTGAISSERESRTLDVLLATPMSAWSILLGKLAGVFPMPMLFLQYLTLHTLLYTVIGWINGYEIISPLFIVHATCIGVGVCALLGGTGVLFSVLCRKNAVAMVANIALWAGLWAGLPFVIAIFDRNFNASFIEQGAWIINPFVMLASSLMGDLAPDWGSRTIEYTYGEPFDWDMGPIAWTILTGIWSALACAVGLAVTWLASRILASRTLRRV